MKNTPFDLTGKVAVITGSSRGIGRSSAELLAKLGARVVISSRKADACRHLFAGIKLAAGDHHLGAELRQQFRRRAADAAARAGDDGYSAREIERGVFHCCIFPDFCL